MNMRLCVDNLLKYGVKGLRGKAIITALVAMSLVGVPTLRRILLRPARCA